MKDSVEGSSFKHMCQITRKETEKEKEKCITEKTTHTTGVLGSWQVGVGRCQNYVCFSHKRSRTWGEGALIASHDHEKKEKKKKKKRRKKRRE